MPVVPLEDVSTHHDVPLTEVLNLDSFDPPHDLGVSKHRVELPRDTELNALLVNQGSDVLVVALHGATQRHKDLPRFEWFRTLRDMQYSSLYFTDPALYLEPRIELAWYTGWRDFDFFSVMADWSRRAATAVGASQVIFLGSSGGGFAALQVATLIPGSLALPFSPQTSIANYLVRGTGLGAQRNYIRTVMPHLTPESGVDVLRPDEDYFASLGDMASPISTYEKPQSNYVLYVQNLNDAVHLEQHYAPFRRSVENGPNHDRVRFLVQEDREGHNPPRQENFKAALDEAADWMHSMR
jgi:hypothetical protein